jgi:hypothetical protein
MDYLDAYVFFILGTHYIFNVYAILGFMFASTSGDYIKFFPQILKR